jgi:hypothetical protein
MKKEVEIIKGICIQAELPADNYAKVFLALHNNFRHFAEDGYYAIKNNSLNDVFLYINEKNKDDLVKYLESMGAKVIEIEKATIIDYVYDMDDYENVVVNCYAEY